MKGFMKSVAVLFAYVAVGAAFAATMNYFFPDRPVRQAGREMGIAMRGLLNDPLPWAALSAALIGAFVLGLTRYRAWILLVLAGLVLDYVFRLYSSWWRELAPLARHGDGLAFAFSCLIGWVAGYYAGLLVRFIRRNAAARKGEVHP